MHEVLIFKTIKAKQQAYSTLWNSKLNAWHSKELNQNLGTYIIHQQALKKLQTPTVMLAEYKNYFIL
jgi:hypothetical protein